MTVLSLGGVPSGLTAADLVNDTKRHLGSMQREPMNKLASPAPTDATSLTFLYDLGAIAAGAHVQVGLELFYVWSVDSASKTATVEPAQLGSLSSEHDQGDVVTANPKFPDFAILRALNDELAELSSPMHGLYSVQTVELDGRSNRSGYDLPGVTDLQEILEVRYQSHNTTSGNWPVVSNVRLGRGISAQSFPSGTTLFLHDGVPTGRKVRVRYRAGFSALTGLDDNLSLTGLPERMADIPPMGAAVRLVAPREIKRNFTEAQGEPRRASEVPPGATASSLRGVASLRERRIQQEAARLLQENPIGSHLPQSAAFFGGGGW